MTTTAKATLTNPIIAAELPNPTTPCQRTSYGPTVAQIDNRLYGLDQGGFTDQPNPAPPYGHREHCADKGYFREKIDGVWRHVRRVLDAWSFPWGTNPNTPDISKMGAHGRPRLFTVNGEDVNVIDCATMDDPNCSTGEHPLDPAAVNSYGLVRPPGTWSRFQVYLHRLVAKGFDRTELELVPQYRSGPGVDGVQALENALLYYEPIEDEKRDDFKGISACHGAFMLGDDDDPSNERLYLWFEFWRTYGQTQFIVREGARDWEIWNGHTWEKIDDGRLPAWLNSPTPANSLPKGNTFPWIATDVSLCHVVPGFRFIALSCPDDGYMRWAVSNSLTAGWKDQGPIVSTAPGIADGTHSSAVDGCYYEENGAAHVCVTVRDPACPGDQFASNRVMDCVLIIEGTVTPDPVVTPPVDPPVVPPTPTLPFAYYLVNPPGTLDESLLTVAHGYVLGDTWYTGPLGWRINKVGEPPPLAGDWIRKDEVKR